MPLSEKKITALEGHDRAYQSLEAISASLLIAMFNDEFGKSHNTLLIGGASEPEYKPASIHYASNYIVFTRDYVSSALHEIAHWCVAGKERLNQVDYGYWYIPDGRNKAQQAEFEQVEVKPQALEWIFTRACGLRFRLSADNLNGPADAQALSGSFKQNIVEQARQYCLQGLNARAQRWVARLQAQFDQPSPLMAEDYTLSLLENG